MKVVQTTDLSNHWEDIIRKEQFPNLKDLWTIILISVHSGQTLFICITLFHPYSNPEKRVLLQWSEMN
jgi:hypothetical protein